MKYFTLSELTYSATARQRGIRNEPDETQRENLRKLVENLLDPIRERWGKPIFVTSGFRSPELNKAVGGVRNSEHLTGCAVDITLNSKVDNERLFKMIRKQDDLEWRQLINEGKGRWIHISYNESDNKNQVLFLK